MHFKTSCKTNHFLAWYKPHILDYISNKFVRKKQWKNGRNRLKKRSENLNPSCELIGKNTNFLKITTFDTNPNQTLQIVFSCQIQSGLKHQFYRFKITPQSCFSRQICDHFHFNRLTKPQKFTRALICLEVVDNGISNMLRLKS